MPRQMRALAGLSLAVSAVLLLAAHAATPAVAFGDAPPPKIDCRKQKNKSHPDCVNPQNPGAPQRVDAAYSAAYVLAQRGEYATARAVLHTVETSGDPRILNYLGFTTRKLGDLQGALVYYRRALAVRPGYAMARSYMGEAYLALGRVADARAELGAIETLCGSTCDAYRALDAALRAHVAG